VASQSSQDGAQIQIQQIGIHDLENALEELRAGGFLAPRRRRRRRRRGWSLQNLHGELEQASAMALHDDGAAEVRERSQEEEEGGGEVVRAGELQAELQRHGGSGAEKLLQIERGRSPWIRLHQGPEARRRSGGEEEIRRIAGERGEQRVAERSESFLVGAGVAAGVDGVGGDGGDDLGAGMVQARGEGEGGEQRRHDAREVRNHGVLVELRELAVDMDGELLAGGNVAELAIAAAAAAAAAGGGDGGGEARHSRGSSEAQGKERRNRGRR
jgi:hypothetical protein